VVVLVHGFPLGFHLWDKQVLPDSWFALAPALPGFDGTPDPPADSTRIDDYARSVLELLDALHVKSFVVGGVSMGGYVTFAIWKLAAARCRGLILADTRAGADTEQGRAAREKMLDLVRREGPAAVANDMMPKLLGSTTRTRRPEVVQETMRMVESQTADGIAAAIVRIRDRPDSTELLPSIGVPCLIIVGEEDELTPPPESEKMAAAIPNARLEWIGDAGHLANLETPNPFNLALRTFLSSFGR
jgi:pimeloyl-ACP methyl ester carboxylesterase